jgi:hypothetical protein
MGKKGGGALQTTFKTRQDVFKDNLDIFILTGTNTKLKISNFSTNSSSMLARAITCK